MRGAGPSVGKGGESIPEEEWERFLREAEAGTRGAPKEPSARARGEWIGRPPAMTEEQIRHARALLANPENTITSIAKLLGVSRTTVYKYVPELAAGRDSLVAPAPRAALPASRS